MKLNINKIIKNSQLYQWSFHLKKEWKLKIETDKLSQTKSTVNTYSAMLLSKNYFLLKINASLYLSIYFPHQLPQEISMGFCLGAKMRDAQPFLKEFIFNWDLFTRFK